MTSGPQSEPRLTSSFLVDKVADALHSGHLTDPSELSDLCFSLARGIDHAIANKEVLLKAKDLPVLVKQVYKCISDCSLQAAAMTLMISVKNACMIGWFQIEDIVDLLTLAEEIGKNFSNTEDINIEPSFALPSISKIISRFYPRIKMGHILDSLEVKAGYRTIFSDFHILKTMLVPMQNQIGLFVAQMDKMDTSSCIMTPPQANFLLNGQGVQGRINISMDTGPQLPTNITAMLKYGINLFQAVGQFNGNYLIVIAFMHVMSSTSDMPVLQDYAQPVLASLDSDSEIIEGPSRVSLNCPISHKRIKTPVKGHLCKHYQCFDYNNFMEMNSRRPSWRCPHCNQSVCHPDIRMCQDIAKILQEVAENVVDVIISADGSWMAVLENEDHTEQTDHETQSCQQERPQQSDSDGISYVPAEVADLTMEGNNAGNAMRKSESMNRQHFVDNPPCSSVSTQIEEHSFCCPMSHTVHDNLSRTTIPDSQLLPSGSNGVLTAPSNQQNDRRGQSRTRDDEPFERSIRRRQYNTNDESRSPLVNILAKTTVNEDGTVTTNITEQHMPLQECDLPLSNSAAPHVSVGGTSTWAGHVTDGNPQLSCTLAVSPVATDVVSPLLNQESVHVHSFPVPLSSRQSQLLRRSNLQSWQFGFGSPIVNNECGSFPSMAINVGGTSTSTPTQGLTAQGQVPTSFEQRALNSLTPSGTISFNYQSTPFMVPNMSGYHAFCGGNDRGQQLLRQLVNSIPVSDMASSSMQNHSFTQNWNVNRNHYISGQAVQQAGSFPAQGLGAHHISSTSSFGHQNPHQSRAPCLRMTSAMTQPQNIVHPSIHEQAVQFQQGGVNNTQTQLRAAAPPMAQMSRTAPFVPVQLQPSRTGSSLSHLMASERFRTAKEPRGRVDETTQPVLCGDGSATVASVDNWQPSGRMRGSLRGDAYAAALRQFMLSSTQCAQVSQTSSGLMTTPHGPLPMQDLVPSSINAQINPPVQTHQRPGGATSWSSS
ncbi:uncharacterized protein LOC126721449 isoform X2 [Quercus robur]|uniref:uncharacterized protein LOC126721449 isoform X2 n=1 Tax=Quercus robur TaxID=38942 RepID=UPI0021616F85|nr:uncharacterized protein LOC126721449 isoform X2 [Quercus robur]